MGLEQELSFRVIMDLGVIDIKEYSTFPKAMELELHHQMVLCHIGDTCWGGGLSPKQRYSRCILKPPLNWAGSLKIIPNLCYNSSIHTFDHCRR